MVKNVDPVYNEIIDAYLAPFPVEVRERMKLIRQTVHEIVPEITEKISYQMPTFVYKKTYLVHFAGYENHVGFYPTPSGIRAFIDELSPYKNAKGSVQFPHNQPLPIDLIRRMILYRRDELNS